MAPPTAEAATAVKDAAAASTLKARQPLPPTPKAGGRPNNRHRFIDALAIAIACLRAIEQPESICPGLNADAAARFIAVRPEERNGTAAQVALLAQPGQIDPLCLLRAVPPAWKLASPARISHWPYGSTDQQSKRAAHRRAAVFFGSAIRVAWPHVDGDHSRIFGFDHSDSSAATDPRRCDRCLRWLSVRYTQVGQGAGIAAAVAGFFGGIGLGNALHPKLIPNWKPDAGDALAIAIGLCFAGAALAAFIVSAVFVIQTWDVK